MLESVKKAYDKNLFDNEIAELKCPVSLEEVETYLQILLPAYEVSLSFQFAQTSIADILSSLRRLFYVCSSIKPNDRS